MPRMNRRTRITTLTTPLATIFACSCPVATLTTGAATTAFLTGNSPLCDNGLAEIAVPPGTPVTIDDEMTATLTEVIRPADDTIAAGNPFNPRPGPGREFVGVQPTVACPAQNTNPRSFSGLNLIPVGNRGVYGPGRFLLGVDRDADLTAIQPGQEAIGRSFFLISQKDHDPVPVYKGPIGDGLAYFALK